MSRYIPIGVAILAAFLVSGCALFVAGAVGGAVVIEHQQWCKAHPGRC